MNKTCLVLGGAGFIGSHIAQTLVDNDYSVRIFDRSDVRLSHKLRSRIEFIKGNLFEFNNWPSVLKDVDYIFHNIHSTIPSTSNDNPIYDVETNVIGNLRFLLQLRDYPIKKIIYSSSGGSVYGQPAIVPIPETHPTDPISSYAITKLAIEKYLHYFKYHYGIDFVSLRYSNVYGIGQDPLGSLGAVTIFLKQIKENKAINIFGNGSVIRDYVYIDDASRANLNAIQKELKSNIYNVGTGVGTSIKELLKLIKEVTGKSFVLNI
jgi:UDP-glucose 4-epimerase